MGRNHLNISGDASRISGDCSRIKGDVSNLVGDVSRLSGDVSEISGDASRISGDCSRIKGDVSNLVGDVSRLSGDVTHMSGNYNLVFGDTSRMESVEAKCKELDLYDQYLDFGFIFRRNMLSGGRAWKAFVDAADKNQALGIIQSMRIAYERHMCTKYDDVVRKVGSTGMIRNECNGLRNSGLLKNICEVDTQGMEAGEIHYLEGILDVFSCGA